MKQYNVTGMSCAACSARVEKAVSKVPGVTSCSVSLLTNSMGVDGTASAQEIIRAVEQAGYGASEKGAGNQAQSSMQEAEKQLEDHETPKLKRRLFWSLGFLLVLMYISMGHMMWGWRLPSFFDGNHVAMGLAQLLLTVIVMVINQRFFISGFKALWNRAPNMDTLVALGSSAAFLYSTYALFAMTGAQVRGDMDAVMDYMMDFYFESAAMILTLITVGKMLEARSKGKTTDALKSLMKLAPKTATVVRGGKEETVPIEQVQSGDTFVVRPGESIPVDGVVLDGTSAVNAAALTGESIPADKAPRRYGLCRNGQPVGLSDLPRHARRAGHDALADHSDGLRRGGDQSADCQNCRQGLRYFCPCGHFDCNCYNACLAADRQALRLQPRARHLGAGHQLPVRVGFGDAGCDHGRQRSRREERHSLQDGSKSGGNRQNSCLLYTSPSPRD